MSSTHFTVCLVFTLAATPLVAQDRQPGTLFTNVRVWDGTSDELQDGMSVLVVNNLITAVSSGPIATPLGAVVIDGGGRVMTPGFIDAHTYMALIAPFNDLENEYSGVYVGAAAGQMA